MQTKALQTNPVLKIQMTEVAIGVKGVKKKKKVKGGRKSGISGDLPT